MNSSAGPKSENDEVYRLSEEERAAVRRGLDEMRRRRFATDEEVKAVFDRFRA
jgi:hypothetical protein